MFKNLVKLMEHSQSFYETPQEGAARLLVEKCRQFRPMMMIDGEFTPAHFDKADISRDGRPRVIAYYTGFVRRRGGKLMQTARYRVLHNGFSLEQTFPVRVKR